MPAKTPELTNLDQTTRLVAVRNAQTDGLPDAWGYHESLKLYSVYFGATADTNDIDNGDTWSSPFAGRVRGWAWQPDGATNMHVTCDPATGIFTFSSASANQTGTLYVWASH